MIGKNRGGEEVCTDLFLIACGTLLMKTPLKQCTDDGNKLRNFTPQRGQSQGHTVRHLPPSGSPANTNDHSAKYRRNSIGLRQMHRLMACLA